MKATLLMRQRVVISERSFAEIVVWQLPEPLEGSLHDFKYRLAFVVNGDCVLRYDNEACKGDHRHWHHRETDYQFISPSQLAADFFADVERYQNEHPDD
jgi:hypothetical protein